MAQAAVPLAVWAAEPGAPQRLGAPTLIWSTVSSWDDFAGSLRTRHSFVEDQRHGRQLKALLGDPDYRDDDTGADVLPTCMAWKSARDREARRPELFAVRANRQFFATLRSRGLLRAGGSLLAVSLGALHQGRCSGWVFAFNPDRSLRKYSLGRRLLIEMLASSCRAGHREFDLSIDLEPYNLGLTTRVRPIGPTGAPPVTVRLADAGRTLLRRHPWCAGPARVLKGWLQTTRG